MALLEIRNLRKSYGSKPALKGASLTVEKGSVFALLGPNGAGKTTLVKCVLDLVDYDGGTIRLDGFDAREPLARRAVAFLPERYAFFPYYTVRSALKFYAEMHGLNAVQFETRLPPVVEKLRLGDLLKQRISTLSKGQLQRVGLGNLLLSDAEMYLLDEPLSGLDPVGIREIKDLILSWKNEGKAVFLNSHQLAEVEQVADSVAILHEGAVLAQGKVAELKADKSLEETFFAALGKDGLRGESK